MTIDRFEGDFAVVETSAGMVNIPKSDLPPEAVEGSILYFCVDQEETENRKKRIEKLADVLFR